MAGQAVVDELICSYRTYKDLLAAVGYAVDERVLADHLGADRKQRSALRRLFRDEAPRHVEVPPAAVEGMKELSASLLREMARASGSDGTELPGPQEFIRQLMAQPQAVAEKAADAVLLNGHRRFIRPQYTSVAELRRLMAEEDARAPFDMGNLAPFVSSELKRRGWDMGEEQVRQLLSPQAEEQPIPHCILGILRRAPRRVPAGLLPLSDLVGDKDPDVWLEETRIKLQFRSHSAMHKAVAEQTGLKYDCVHKSLSGRKKAKRIQAAIVHCLREWLACAEQGKPIPVCEDYLGVPIAQTYALLPELEKRFGTKEEVYRAIAQETGIKACSVRRYFQGNGQLKYTPLAVYLCAQKLASGPCVRRPLRSYLSDGRVRRAAYEIARRAGERLRQWQAAGDDLELELTFRELRRALIATLKEQRRVVPAVP